MASRFVNPKQYKHILARRKQRQLYHNGRGQHVNHGLHAFSLDGSVWHKPTDALTPGCIAEPRHANCTHMYNDTVVFTNGSTVAVAGRERPTLLFDSRGRPTHLFTGIIPVTPSQRLPWYVLAQPIDLGL